MDLCSRDGLPERRSRSTRAWGGAGAGVLAGLALIASPAAANRFNVNTTADGVDAAPGDGVCETAPANAQCTLRAAIQESNALAGLDTVAIAAGTYTLTLAGTDEDAAATGDLDVTDTLDIKGVSPGSTIIDGANADRIFDLQPGSSLVRIANVTIRHGAAPDGGAIRFARPLQIHQSRLRDNEATFGGALNADVTLPGSTPQLTLVHTELRSNHALAGGGGGYVTNASSVSLRDSELVQNHAGLMVGALDAFDTSVTVTDSRFSQNDCGSAWSAMIANNATVSGTTFDGNVSGVAAGALQIRNSGEVTNCTFSDNTAPLGGALTGSGSAIIDVNNSTFFGNHASNGDANQGAAIALISGGMVSLANSVMESNFPNGCSAFTDPVSVGFNTASDSSCSLGASGDVQMPSITLVDPTLADNGGPTPTHALFDGSPAIDTSNPAAGSNAARDQRGAGRPAHGTISIEAARSDRGAFEVCKPGLVLSLTDTDGDGMPDECDDDDDGDGCPDLHDAHPLQSSIVVGQYINACGGNSPYSMFEGNDSDGDGLRNCEDDDDDDDGIADSSDSCQISTLPPGCSPPGANPCPPKWFVCWGGSCVELFLKFWEVINPQHVVRFERFEILNELIYIVPQAGTTAVQGIASITKAFTPTAGAAAKTATSALAVSAAASGSARVAIEIWAKATRQSRERLVARVAEYETAGAKVGALNTGNVIVMAPPAREGAPLALRTSWAIGANPAELPDLDGDRRPDGFDNCTYVENADQADADRNGIGDACDARRKAVPPSR